jgi:magnesium-transporting ATPase (P-type)
MLADLTEIFEIGFNVIYLIFISTIVTFMIVKMNKVSGERKSTALHVLVGFGCLLIGDIGHVGARLIVFFSENLEENTAILGIGALLEMIGLIFLYIFWTETWRLEFSKAKAWIYYILIIVGICGLVIFTFPQNNWLENTTPYLWLVFRNLPWLIQGIGISLLIVVDAKRNGNKTMKRIGFCIFFSFFFYMPVIFAGHIVPMLGMLMIPGTIIYMIWEYTSLKYFFYNTE